MNDRCFSGQTCRLPRVLIVTLLALVARSASAAEDKAAPAKNASPPGALLLREADGKSWRAVKPKEAVPAGAMLVALPGSRVESDNGAVRLLLLSDLAQISPYPVVESAVILRNGPNVDLDFMIDRGRVDVVNTKEEGAAKVRVGFRDVNWELTLNEPGTRVAIELYGRWTSGIPISAKGNKADEAPDTELILLVLKGQAELSAGNTQFALHAPPGPAVVHWDSQRGAGSGPRRLEKLPDWADPEAGDAARVKELQASIERSRQRMASGKSVEDALAMSLASDSPVERRVALYGMASLDLLGPVVDALADKRVDVRESAILALRHWIGRGATQSLKVYDAVVERMKFSPAQGESVLQLLHSPDESERSQPELYETLIAYLQHSKLPIRELARWHLYRLVPAGRDIRFDAAAGEAERGEAVAKWKKLIPDGKLPPREK